MSDGTDELLIRLARLERSEKLLRLTLYLVVALLAATAAFVTLLLRWRGQEFVDVGAPLRGRMIPQSGFVSANGLVIRDAAGNNRVWVGVDAKDDTAKIRLLDAKGGVRVTLRAGADRGALALFDAQGRIRAVSSADALGAAGFMVLDERERPRAAFGTLTGGEPSLTLLDGSGAPVARVPAQK